MTQGEPCAGLAPRPASRGQSIGKTAGKEDLTAPGYFLAHERRGRPARGQILSHPGGDAVAGRRERVWAAAGAFRPPAQRSGHLLARCGRPLDRRAWCGAAHRSVLFHHARRALGRLRVAVGTDLRRRLRGLRVDRHRRPHRGGGRACLRAADAISAAGACTRNDPHSSSGGSDPGGAAHAGASSPPRAAGHGGVGRRACARERPPFGAALCGPAFTRAVGQPARQRDRRHRTDRSRRH